MKTLIVHPEDFSTIFLAPIYDTIKNKTVIEGGVSKAGLRSLIEVHDRVLMLGHGTSRGLLNTGSFEDTGLFVIDETHISLLKVKRDNIYIWCHSDQFVKNYQLSGLCCGMFISDLREAYSNGFRLVNWKTVIQSNDIFARIISRYIDGPIDVLYSKVLTEYGVLANTNPIAKFNHERINLVRPAHA